MSDQLAVSACLSVLMMSIYLLFGSDAAREPFGPDQLRTTHTATAPGLPRNPVQLLLSAN